MRSIDVKTENNMACCASDDIELQCAESEGRVCGIVNILPHSSSSADICSCPSYTNNVLCTHTHKPIAINIDTLLCAS